MAERKPFWAKCGACDHCWPAAYLPMDLAACAMLLMRAACPKCAAAKGIKVARQKDGVLLSDENQLPSQEANP